MLLIGLKVEIIKSSDRKKIGLKGIVVDETKHTLLIEKPNKKVVCVPKIGCTFRFRKDEKIFDIEGGKILTRPEDRY